jgi:hypothetical protein
MDEEVKAVAAGSNLGQAWSDVTRGDSQMTFPKVLA